MIDRFALNQPKLVNCTVHMPQVASATLDLHRVACPIWTVRSLGVGGALEDNTEPRQEGILGYLESYT
jgi:hypothetical protein